MIFSSGVSVVVVFLLEARDTGMWMETGGPGNPGARAILAVGKDLVWEYASATIQREYEIPWYI